VCWLIAGLAIFFGVHLFTSFRPQRERLIGRLGERAYKAVYALLALAGFGLIVFGMTKTEPVALWVPPPWGRHAALWFMPFAFIAVAASVIPSNFRRITAHPLLWGVTSWALLHLLANGDLAGLLLFGAFLLYSVYAMWSQTRRGAKPAQTKRPIVNDIAVVAAGLVAYWVVLHFHANLFGVAV
jgi:uncharacterized membrane protein